VQGLGIAATGSGGDARAGGEAAMLQLRVREDADPVLCREARTNKRSGKRSGLTGFAVGQANRMKNRNARSAQIHYSHFLIVYTTSRPVHISPDGPPRHCPISCLTAFLNPLPLPLQNCCQPTTSSAL
jgi:hypothetical protein